MGKPHLLIAGTFHFGDTDDLLKTDELHIRGNELSNVIHMFADFRPNRLAFEVEKEQDEALNRKYVKFLEGNRTHCSSEVELIGFPLAERLGHERIHGVDWMGNVGQRSAGEVLEWAELHQPRLHQRIVEDYIPQLALPSPESPVKERLIQVNDPQRLKVEHEMYMQIARVGRGTDYIGVDWMRWWYQRNLTIYHNLTQLNHSTDDRLLLMIGSAHVHLVSQFLRESGDYEVLNLHDII
ncbi:DUF5694 domain-containing protein [Alteribacter natronophilus]|uniref:DUF5694 domain-containing protein n=1 Tax=Alteribacter natronophilus TaxID=2583810 RepID=UPI00110E7129|nr:DUF5694 domain-containing protein [Alteribacter natronophilus]TMW70739.1 hypothetical protein FGB90_16290 [Alteribacter natronophilus]